MFDPVPQEFNVPGLEEEVLAFWAENQIERRYLERNAEAEERFSFLDGPITANGQMGVHHAWGRTYKDLWQRYNTMLGKRQRYQNGFDCQGLWVEVSVERKLGFKSKRDIEAYGIAEFVRACKEDVFAWAAEQTRQSERLGYFMDWPNSYYTLSDENNYTIWHFLKKCRDMGLIYRGRDVMPWCTRCGTGLSEHEIATEGYQELTHRSVFVRFPLLDRPDESLLVWTTTPWTLTSNVAVAVNPALTYLKVRQGDQVYYVAKGAVAGALRGQYETLDELPGAAMLDWEYRGPFDELPAEQGVRHRIIPWDDVSQDEGTGLVHIAPGCGKEDFALGQEFGLDVIAPLDQYGVYQDGFDWLSGQNVQDATDPIITDLEAKGVLYRAHEYSHRYPVCWRCGTQLVFRLVDEWFISMDPLREPMMEVVRKIRWIPSYGLDRELDWLRNMSDWMISKKRYWGLALPFWRCPDGHLTVIGGKDELFERAIGGLDHLESPHRPWVDAVRIRCDECGQIAERIPDVGNPWLDAGIVPYSTLHYDTDRQYWADWFPADFITESFPGQFRNWFYSMLAMSTVLEDTNPFKTVLGYALVKDQSGREMHKSWGNLIPFDEAAARAGADTMRWLFCLHNPETNLNFGWDALDDVKRRLLTLWNTYRFFVTYAVLDGWTPDAAVPVAERPELDRWVLARLNTLIGEVRAGLDRYDSVDPARAIERFIEDLSTWYVRRSRRRFWRAENDTDKLAAYTTLWEALAVLARLIAPFLPFLAETLYQNLVRSVISDAPASVHLTDYPVVEGGLIDEELLRSMGAAQQVVALGHAARGRAKLNVRQPLATIFVTAPDSRAVESVQAMRDIILDELNVKQLRFSGSGDQFVTYSVRPNLPVLGPRYGKLMPAIRRALDSLDPEAVAAAVERGETVSLNVDGDEVTLQPTDILPSAQQREGFAAMAAGGYVVALDTELTPQLRREGLARQVVRRLNDWRKNAGYNIEDRIQVQYEASPEMAETIQQYGDYIQSESLATSLRPSSLGAGGYRAEARMGDEWLRVEMRREATVPAS